MKFDDSVWDRWVDSANKIKDDLQQTVEDQAIFCHFQKIVNDNYEWIEINHGNEFVWFVYDSYVHKAIMQIRRQIKNQNESHSFVRLLSQIKEYADQITYAYYLKRFPITKNEIPWQKRTFRILAKRNSDDYCRPIEEKTTISSEMIDTHLKEIDELNKSIVDVADKFIAHNDRKRSPKNIEFEDLKKSIDKFHDLFIKYYCFLTSDNYSSLESVITFPWQKIFLVPLVKPKTDPS